MALIIPKSFSGTSASIKSQAEALLAKATTLTEINNIVAAARSSNVALDPIKLSTAKTTVTEAANKSKAAADKAIADKAAAAKAAADKAALEKRLADQKAQQEKAMAAINAKLAADYKTQLNNANTTQEINAVLDKARTSGVTLDAATLASANNRAKIGDFNASLRSATSLKEINDLVAKADAAKLGYDRALLSSVKEPFVQQSLQKYQQQLATATSLQAVNTIARQAESELGRPLDPSSIAKQTQGIIQGYANQIKSAKSIDELTALQQKMQTDGANLDPKLFAGASADIQKQIAAQQAEIQNAKNTQINQIRTNFINNVINKNTATQAQIDEYTKAITDAGGTPDANLVERAQGYITNAANQAKLTQAKEFQNEIIRASNAGTLTKAQVADIAARAKAAGTPLDDNQIAQANESAQKFTVNNYNNEISNARTQDELDSIVARAKADGVTTDQLGNFQRTTQNIATIKARTDDIARFVTDQQTMPGLPQMTYGPNNAPLYSIPPDPTTGFKGGWYSLDSANNTWRELGKDGQPTGRVLDQQSLDTQANTTGYNLAVKYGDATQAAYYATALRDPVKFEATLPKPTTADFDRAQLINQNLSYGVPRLDVPTDGRNPNESYSSRTGPDGTDYIYQPPNLITGEPGMWLKSTSNQNVGYNQKNYVPVGQPTATPVSYAQTQQYRDQLVKQNYDITNQQAYQLSQQYFQSEIDRKAALDQSNSYNFFKSVGLGAVDKLIEKTIGYDALFTIAGTMMGGPWGAALGNAAAGVAQGRDFKDVVKNAMLSYATAYGTQALTQALSQTAAVGAEMGIGGAEQLSSGIGDTVQIFDDGSMLITDPTTGLPVGGADIGGAKFSITDGVARYIDTGLPLGGPKEINFGGGTNQPVEPVKPIEPGGGNKQIFDDGSELITDPVTGKPIGYTDTTGKMIEIKTTPVIPEDDVVWSDIVGEEKDLVGRVGGEPTTRTGGPAEGGYGDYPEDYNIDIEVPVEPTQPVDGGGYTGGEIELPPVTVTPPPGGGLPPLDIPDELLPIIIGGPGIIGGGGGGGGSPPPGPVEPPPPVETPPVETPPVETPPQIDQPVDRPVETPPPPVEPPPVGGPVEPPPVSGPPPVEPPPVVAPPPVSGPVSGPPPVEPPPVSGPVEPPYEPPPLTEPPVDVPVEPPYEPPPLEEPPGTPPDVPVEDYSRVLTPEQIAELEAGRIPFGTSIQQIWNAVSAGLLAPAILGTLFAPTPTKKTYGPLDPINWGATGRNLVQLGVNPGFAVGAGQQPMYQTTNPYQSQFFWGQRPGYQTMEDLVQNYNRPPGAPAQGYGLQAGPATFDVNQYIQSLNQNMPPAPGPIAPEVPAYTPPAFPRV